jgi:LAO/AO transport system kinase
MLGKALTRIADATVHEALEVLATDAQADSDSWRCGVTGPAGAGKSSLLGRFANARLARNRRVGIVAIDPTSPYSQGAILGDRIRIDGHGDSPELFVRSLASRRAEDGLADNLANVIALLAHNDFDDILVETVGAGQSQYEIRHLVDTLVVVLMPGAGDMVQAVKAGILECGDIYVVNKADLPGAQELVGEIESVLSLRKRERNGEWTPPVIAVSALHGDGLEQLDETAEAHRSWHAMRTDIEHLRRERIRSHVRALLQRRLAEVLEESPIEIWEESLATAYRRVLDALNGRPPDELR